MEHLNSDLIRLFSYSSEERAAFRYIDRYMRFIDRNRVRVTGSHEAFKNFMLAGLFLTYRAFNHSSVDMTTDPDALADMGNDIHVLRLKAVGKNVGPILSTDDYLRQLHVSSLRIELLLPATFLICSVKKSF